MPVATCSGREPCNRLVSISAVPGGNPAANASYADAAFVANRFRVVQRRYHV